MYRTKSNINEDALRKILFNYRLENASVERISAGDDNMNFVVSQGDRRNVLRIYGITRREEVAFEVEVIQLLVEQGFPTPQIVRTKRGRLVFSQSGVTSLLFQFIEGAHIDPQGRQSGERVAHAIANLHQVTMEKTFGGQRSRTDIGRLESFVKYAAKERELASKSGCREFEVHIRVLLEQLAQRLRDIPVGVVHHDLNPGNILVDNNNNIVALIDFDEAYSGPVVFDIASLIHNWGERRGEAALDLDSIASLVRWYSSIRSLTAEEKNVLSLVLRAFHAADAVEYIMRNYDKRPKEFELSDCRSLQMYYSLTEDEDTVCHTIRGA